MVYKSQILVLSAATLLSGVVAQESGKCEGQSCYIAYISGSAATKYDLPAGKEAVGASKSGETCINEYLGKFGVKLPAANAKANFLKYITTSDVTKRNERLPLSSAKFEMLKQEQIREEKALEKRQGKCTPYTLLYSRGTLEPGALGITLGPALSKEMGKRKDWSVQAVTTIGKLSYKASAQDNYCVGLPGGYVCREVLNKLSADCPNTKIVVGGYSQGAMVSRICVAYANEKARSQVKGLLLYGDPMNGADVKGVPTERVKTICNKGDGVCKGEFSISAAHLSYFSQVTEGANWADQIVQK